MPDYRSSLYARWCACLSLVCFAIVALLSASCAQRSESASASSKTESIVSPNNAITQGADEMRTSWYPDQPGLSPAAVASFKQLFNTTLIASQVQSASDKILAQPLVYGNNVLAVTEANNLYLVDGTTGVVVKTRTLAGGAFDASAALGCGDISPTVGITGTPVIDNQTGIAYFYSKNAAGDYAFHAVNVGAPQPADLAERPGFPITITGAAQNDAGAVFTSRLQLQRPALLLMNGVVYAAFGAHCDQGAYRGWIIGVSTAGVVKARFTTRVGAVTAGQGNGIWMSGSGLASDGPNRIFFVTGNGGGTDPGPLMSNAPPGNLVEAAVRVDVQGDGSLKAMDFFSPFNGFNMADADLSGGGVVLLPSQFGTAAVPNTAAVVGKEGLLYLMDRSKLGGYKQGGNGGNAVLSETPINGSTRSHAAAWPGDGGYVYVVASGADANNNGYRLRVFKFAPNAQGLPALSLVGTAGAGTGDDFGQYSGSPVVTSDNLTSGSAVVWATSNTGALRAYSAVPVNGVLNRIFEAGYNDEAKFTKPGLGNGKVYVGTDNGRLVGFGAAASPVSGNPLAFGAVDIGQTKTLTATITANQTVTISAIASSNNAVFTPGASAPALPVTLNAGQTVTVPVTFKPTAATGYSAALNITTNAGAGAVSLGGTGQTVGPKLTATPTSINFGGVAPGGSSSVNVILQNTGTQTLTFSGSTLPAAPFSAAGAPANAVTLAVNASITVTVTYTPTQQVTSNGNLSVNSNGGNITIPLVGTSAPPAQMVITPLSLDFGTIASNTTKTLNFTLKNTGGLTLIIQKSKPPVQGKFAATTTLGEGDGIAPGQTVTESVTLSSTTAGTFTDSWIITGSDASGQQNVAFSGTVTVAAAPLPRAGWVASANATGGAEVPANALDGTTATRWTTAIAQSSATTQSFTVDMLAAQTINQITMASDGDYARSYQVFATNDQANWGAAIATGTGTAALTVVTFPQMSARYVQVRQLPSAGTGAWWSINDFNVFGTGSPPPNGDPLVRTGWAVSASASAGADVPANAVDANAAGTRWSSGIAQNAASTQSYTIDLLSAQAFAKITLDSGGDYARSYQVFASNDPANFGAAIATGTGTAALTTITFATQTTRYIRIQQLTNAATAWWSIYDLNVYSPGSGPVALSRTGWVASGSATGDPPANAIDGVAASRWSTTASQVSGQFFQVDMIAAKTFKQLTLDAAGSADYPRGYQVFVSNDGATWGAAIATGAPSTPLVTVTFPTQTARYIKVVQTGTVTPNWWSLYEFNVYN